jgi:hypothetical protein
VIALTNNISGKEENTAEFEPCKLAIKAMIFSVPYARQNF